MRKFLKYTGWSLLAVVATLFVVIGLLYVPWVQDFARRKAVKPLSKALGMELSVGSLRLGFPLRLAVGEVRLIDRGDTLVDCGRLTLDVDPWPLIRRQAVLRDLTIERLKARYHDTATGFDMRIAAARFGVEQARAALREERATIRRIALDSASIRLRTGSGDQVEKPDTTAPPGWEIAVDRLSIHQTGFAMESDGSELTVRLAEGGVDSCRVGLGSQQVEVAHVELDRGSYAWLTASSPAGTPTGEGSATIDGGNPNNSDNPDGRSTSDNNSTPPITIANGGNRAGKASAAKETPAESDLPANEPASAPWTVRVGGIELNDNQLTYGTAGHHPTQGLDPSWIELAGVHVAVDSLYNRGSDLALQIRQLAFRERCGLEVEQTRGRFSMDSTAIRLTDFSLATAASRLTANMEAGGGLLQMEPQTPLTVSLGADLATNDMARLVPALLPAALRNRQIGMELTADGTLEDLRRIDLQITSPDHLWLTVDGRARYPLDPRHLTASARIRGRLRNGAFLLEMLPDTALRRRLALPRRIGIDATARIDRQNYVLSSLLRAGQGRREEGCIHIDGRFDARNERYEAAIRADSFPAGSFLPADSLGRLGLALDAQGKGFDPYDPATWSRLQLEVSQAEYRGRDFGGVGITAELADQQLQGRIEDRDSALHLSLGLEGRLTREQKQARLTGRVGWFDLAALGLVSEPIGGLFDLEAEASATPTGSYAARVALDSIRVRNGSQTETIRPTSFEFATDSVRTRAAARSGDLELEFRTPESLERFLALLPHSTEELERQVRAQRLDMDSLKPVLPDFLLRLTAGQNNILNNYLRTRRMAFRRLEMRGANCDSLPLALGMHVEGLTTGNLRIDTIGMSLRQQGQRMRYALRMANAPGNLDHVAAAGLRGDLVGNTATMHLYQRDRSGREGLRSGLNLTWNDSLIRLSLGPDPQFGFEPWSVNPGNYLVYRYDRQLEADLDLTRGSQRFALHSIPASERTAGIRLVMAGLGIGSMLELLPSAPPVDGQLGADLSLTLGRDTLALGGDITVGELAYDRQPFGDLALRARYGQGREQRAEVRLAIDTAEVLAATASYDAAAPSPLDARIALRELPLQRFDAFLPAEMLRLTGSLSGRLQAEGAIDAPQLDGRLHFAGTELRVPMIGTSFRLSEDTIRFDESRLRFDRYAILAPNRQPLTIDGQIDLSDLQRMTADLRLQASDFQFVNVPRRERTEVYGQAYLDLNTSIRGPVDALAVRGRVALLGGTDINYVMQSSPLEVKQQSQDVVRFVSFAQIDNREAFEELPPVRIGGMDVALNIDINNDVKAAVDLSTDGSNRIDLRGGGNLSFTMNPLGDMRLSGRYLLTGGTVQYNPPVIAQKVFRIQPGGYVEWLGDVADPSFNITAVESVRANVSSDGENSRAVNFNISINIRNTLTDLAISFDLSAPEDLTMQNQLNSLTAEQRANQAMNLLIYNTYTGPGTSARVSSENPLNTFIQKELNQWAQNNLKGVDLSFGIDSYGQDDPNGQRTDYSYRLSKNLFSNRIRAVIGGKFSTDSDPSQNLRENLIDDISIEYMLDKRDNMYIKLFRHTGYESILEGEITETGVGFVIRKRLSRLGDLFRSSKPRTPKPENHEDDPQ